MKLRNPHPYSPLEINGPIFYDIYNLTTNLKKFPSTSETDKTVYNLTDAGTDAGMSDVYIFFDIPYKIIDTSTPHIIKTKNGGIHTSGTRNYTKEVNTLTNITTYTGQDTLYAGEDGKVTIAANMKATAYPNGTAILEARQR